MIASFFAEQLDRGVADLNESLGEGTPLLGREVLVGLARQQETANRVPHYDGRLHVWSSSSKGI
jgi:hypothetical protein